MSTEVARVTVSLQPRLVDCVDNLVKAGFGKDREEVLSQIVNDWFITYFSSSRKALESMLAEVENRAGPRTVHTSELLEQTRVIVFRKRKPRIRV